MTGMNDTATPRITGIARYPVKGLGPDRLERVGLSPGETLPFDRAWAIENGRSGFDPADPQYLPKSKFLMLMRNARLAMLDPGFDADTRVLSIRRDGKPVVSGCLDEAMGRQVLEQFFSGFMEEDLRGAPRILSAPGHSFSDVAAKCVSIINEATVKDIARVVGRPVDPLRFRGNFLIDGLPAWAEFGWLGREISLGGARVEVTDRIQRCAATNVDPATARRDMQLPKTLMGAFGHMDCGVYARVVAAGPVSVGDAVRGPEAD
jgi:hypothetical protein